MRYSSQILLLLVWSLLQVACSSNAVYTTESFGNDSPFKRRIDGDVALACESARRALLGQGYLIEAASNEGIKARKAVKREDEPNTFIEMNVVCLPERKGSTLFAAALLSTYDLKKSSSSASVGLSAVGSISLPIGQSVDSLVKVSEETIDDKTFYASFFSAVTDILAEMHDGDELAEAVGGTGPAIADAPLSPPAPTEPTPIEPEPGTLPASGQSVVPEAGLPVPAPASTPDPAPLQPVPAVEPSAAPAQAVTTLPREPGTILETPPASEASAPTGGASSPAAEAAEALAVGTETTTTLEATALEPVTIPDREAALPEVAPAPAGNPGTPGAGTVPVTRPTERPIENPAPPAAGEPPSLPDDLF